MVSDELTHIENLERGLTAKQENRLAEVRHHMAIAVAREYGTRLHAIMADKVVRDVITRPEVLAHLEGATVAELPSDASGWAGWAKEAVQACELCQRSLAASDDALRERLTTEVVAGLRPDRRISMAREGSLDGYVANEVEERFESELRAFAV